MKISYHCSYFQQTKTFFFFFHLQETLDLSHNDFSHFSCNMEMVWTSSLKRLNLSNNHLGSLSWNVCQLSGLQDLDLSHNVLRQLPKPEFWKSTTLHKLNLSSNKVIKYRRVLSIICSDNSR